MVGGGGIDLIDKSCMGDCIEMYRGFHSRERQVLERIFIDPDGIIRGLAFHEMERDVIF